MVSQGKLEINLKHQGSIGKRKEKREKRKEANPCNYGVKLVYAGPLHRLVSGSHVVKAYLLKFLMQQHASQFTPPATEQPQSHALRSPDLAYELAFDLA